MRLRLILGGTLLAAITATAQTQNLQGDLQRVKQREASEGCKVVLPEYEGIAKQGAKNNRAAAAEALLRAGMCYEQSGRVSDAAAAYARVVADFPDVAPHVAEARRRAQLLLLPNGRGANASTASASQETTRLLWTLSGPRSDIWVRQGSVSPNGQQIAISGANGSLMLRDLSTGRDRPVVAPAVDGSTRVGDVGFSRDGRRLVYEVINSVDVSVGLRIIDLDQPGIPTPRVILNADARPCDWSPDGKWIAARIRNVDKPLAARRNPSSLWQLVLVSVSDGSVRVLKTVQDRYRSRTTASFSVDGRSVAFEVPESSTAGVRDIVVFKTDGTGEVAGSVAKGDDALLGWAPDGSGLLFTTTRGSGASSIWRQGFVNDKPAGGPDLVRKDGPSWPVGLSPAGALYWFVDNEGGVSVKSASFDTATGRFLTPLEDVPSTFVRSSRRPKFSPDGKLLGFISVRGDIGGNVFVSRNLETGETRETSLDVYFRNGNVNLWFWVPDNRSILTIGEDQDPAVGLGLFQTDLSNGRSTLVVPKNLGNVNFAQNGINLQNTLDWSADGRTLSYSYLAAANTYARVSRDMKTGEETPIPRKAGPQSPDGSKTYLTRRIPDGAMIFERTDSSSSERDLVKVVGGGDWLLTNDGKFIVAVTLNPPTHEDQVVVYSIADGSTRLLMKTRTRIGISTLAPDQQSVFVQGTDATGSALNWWVPFDGRPARLLEELAGFETVGWEFHPDGRRVALQINHRRTLDNQLFVLENFLPKR